MRIFRKITSERKIGGEHQGSGEKRARTSPHQAPDRQDRRGRKVHSSVGNYYPAARRKQLPKLKIKGWPRGVGKAPLKLGER